MSLHVNKKGNAYSGETYCNVLHEVKGYILSRICFRMPLPFRPINMGHGPVCNTSRVNHLERKTTKAHLITIAIENDLCMGNDRLLLILSFGIKSISANMEKGW